MQAFQIAPGPIYQPEKLVRDPLYRRWIKQFPCLGCGATWGIDPCHTGPHGLNQKACDSRCIPLCRKCHDAFDANPELFAQRHGWNLTLIINLFNQVWKWKQQGGNDGYRYMRQLRQFFPRR
jgi:hypothetical protein